MFSLLSNLRELTEELRELSNQHHDFGFGIYPHELASIADSGVGSMLLPHRRRQRYTPYSGALKKKGSKENQVADLTVGKDGFQVCMDVQNFKPNELTVKTVGNAVVVEGKHEEREDNHGFISRHFVRKYTLPAGYDSKDVVSTLSSDGVLTVKAPPPAKALPTNERVIEVQQTGPAHLSNKENSNENEENGRMEA